LPPTDESTQEELTRRHRASVSLIIGALASTLLLMGLAVSGWLGGPRRNPQLEGALRIVIVFFGLGAVYLRRTRFALMRLQDIAALRGPRGLLAHLQKTTLYVVLIADAIAVMGFAITLMTGFGSDMLWLGAIAVLVLLYAWPRRAAWQRVVEATSAGAADAGAGRAAKGTTA